MFDLKKREITGITVDGEFLRLATLEVSQDLVKVVKLQRARLLSLPDDLKDDRGRDDLDIPGNDEDDETAIFGLSDTEPAGPGVLEESLDEDWDMTQENIPGLDDKSNATIMADLLREHLLQSITTSVAIPLNQTHLQLFSDIDVKKLSRKKITATLHERMETMYDHPIAPDQLVWHRVNGNGTLLVGSIERDVFPVTVLDAALPLFDGKIMVKTVLSEELILAGLIRTNYTLLDHEYTCIVHVEENNTTLIFMKGKEFHAVLPVIKEGSKNQRVGRTIFSKILFEVDRGKIPTLDRIVVTGDTLGGNLLLFLADQFIDVEVTPFEYDGDKFDVDATLDDDYRDYLKAIGIAWAGSDHAKADFIHLSFLPKYIQVRQQVFKLDWHGYVLLAMIALMPVLGNHYYQLKKADFESNRQTIQLLDRQISETRAVTTVVENLSAEYALMEAKAGVLDELSANTLKWSRTLQLINAATEGINSLWFTNFQGSPENLIIQGTALYRDRIPQISNRFHRATLQQVTEREERGIIVYDFVLLVNEVVDDPDFFDPEKAILPEQVLELTETTGTRGTIRQ